MIEHPAERRPQLYGRRLGRPLRRRKSELVETLLPRLRLTLPEPGGRLTPASLFPAMPTPPRAVWLEVGFGGGEHLADQAQAHPDIGFIGCEPFVNGVAGLLKHVDDRGLMNVRIQPDDARPLIDALPDASIGRCFVLFADPWPKKRHALRRFIGPENLPRLSRILEDGAELRLASDDMGLVRWMLEHTWRHPDFEWLARAPSDWRQRPADCPPTRYEQKAIEAGRKPVFLRFQRRARVGN
ncbi:MAG TPA: tRNA (guanine(46)-N(7))-methyltransferase TrmB [Azospirillaceae bacterium]|nr:tRNA (guanine(46)-N(7))-methyltransferase TrmB [Azospirillaceae bacterium]